MEDIMKIVKSLEDYGLLLKGVCEKIQNKAIEQKGEFISMLLGILGASLLGNMLAGTGLNRTGYVSEDLRSKGYGMIRAGYRSERSLMKIFFNYPTSFN